MFCFLGLAEGGHMRDLHAPRKEKLSWLAAEWSPRVNSPIKFKQDGGWNLLLVYWLSCNFSSSKQLAQ